MQVCDVRHAEERTDGGGPTAQGARQAGPACTGQGRLSWLWGPSSWPLQPGSSTRSQGGVWAQLPSLRHPQKGKEEPPEPASRPKPSIRLGAAARLGPRPAPLHPVLPGALPHSRREEPAQETQYPVSARLGTAHRGPRVSCRAERQAGQRGMPPQGRRGLCLAQVFPAAMLLYTRREG